MEGEEDEEGARHVTKPFAVEDEMKMMKSLSEKQERKRIHAAKNLEGLEFSKCVSFSVL